MQDRPQRSLTRFHLLAALVVLILGCWASSGTLAPYGATYINPQVLECDYLGNLDHWHFWQPYLLFQNVPPEQWQSAIKLRRILYPLLSWPFVATFGFLIGGFIANVLLVIGTAAYFLRFIHLRDGPKSTVVTAWLLASYPGIAYWAGLPYSYASIVPSMLVAAVLMSKMEADDCSAWRSFLLASGVGILFTAYDGLLLILIPAVVWMVLRKKRWLHLPLAIGGLLWPMGANTLFLTWVLKANLVNSNSITYYYIFNSYLHGPWSLGKFWINVLSLPQLTASALFNGNFFFLPVAFLFFMVLNMKNQARGLKLAEESLLLAAFGVLLFLNLAPHYPGWQMRGEWVARLYQPIVVVFLLVIARGMAQNIILPPLGRQLRFAVVFITVFANAWVVFGGLHKSKLTDMIYQGFLKHPHHVFYLYNLEKYGVRPLGFCRDQKDKPS